MTEPQIEAGRISRVGFFGRGILGQKILEDLLNDPLIEVPIIVTCGTSPEVAEGADIFGRIASAHGIPFIATNQLNHPDVFAQLQKAKLDLAIAIQWLYTINERVIAASRLGFLNCHGGMLPRYRGNACINWAILNRESEAGVTVHLMQGGRLDSGPILKQTAIPLTDSMTCGEFIQQAAETGRLLVLEAARDLLTGKASPRPQDERAASFCFPRLPRDGEIDWTQDAGDVARLVRAANRPYPGAYSYFSDVLDGNRIKKLIVWRAHSGQHEFAEFFAVPGHLMRLSTPGQWAVACGGTDILFLDEVEIDGVSGPPSQFFRSVRQRLGLDVGSYIADFDARLRQLEMRTAPSTNKE